MVVPTLREVEEILLEEVEEEVIDRGMVRVVPVVLVLLSLGT